MQEEEEAVDENEIAALSSRLRHRRESAEIAKKRFCADSKVNSAKNGTENGHHETDVGLLLAYLNLQNSTVLN